jgi:hypothetical protein
MGISLNDIEVWLREQWAGLFRELLIRMSSQQQLATLSAQVAQLSQLNETLKRYLEEVVTKVSPQEAPQLIAREAERLEEEQTRARLRGNRLIHLLETQGFPLEVVHNALSQATSVDAFFNELELYYTRELKGDLGFIATLKVTLGALEDADSARAVLGLPALMRDRLVRVSASKKIGNTQDEHKGPQPRTSDGAARRNKRTT